MDLVDEVLAGKVAAGARLIRWLEDEDPRAGAALARIYPHTGRAHLIGITGPPGAGKSTLAGMLIGGLRARGHKVGVIAVDPSSPFSGGAILGDRVRMQRHAADEGVFIRSMGSRGQHGGLARASFDAMLVLDAMGYDTILVETVGVGQEEIEIVALAHSTIIVAVPGLGDEIQAIKAGLMEAGDLFVVNKADRDGAHETLRQLELALHLREQAGAATAWKPPLLAAVAARDEGGAAILDALEAHAAHLRASGAFEAQRAERGYAVFLKLLRDAAMRKLLDAALERDDAALLLDDLKHCRIDPHRAADLLVARLRIADA
ncbi:MAG: methylmalonyl Co-A mutase-associated GTPase MeaB [Pseudomonadales bacterium]|nr:methylmalonyl Co-A mutase-associated GTPase MeaB [Pseudomonadales bacterium]